MRFFKINNRKISFFPFSKEPISFSIPNALAPLIVAISKTVWALTIVGSKLLILCNKAATFISSNISRLLLEQALSVPNPTFIPELIISGKGIIPEANFIFEIGQWTTEELVWANIFISFLSNQQQWAKKVRSSKMPALSKISIGRFLYFFKEKLTSNLVSEVWVVKISYFYSANFLALIYVSKEVVWNIWGAKET